MFVIYAILFFLLLIPIGLYLYKFFLRSAVFWGLNGKNKKVKIVVAFLAFGSIIWSANLFGFGILVIVHMIAVAIFMEILNFIYIKLNKNKDAKYSIWNKIFCSGLVPVIATVLILGYGYFNMENVLETHYTVYTGKLTRQQGYRIAMIADLHFGTTMNEEKLKKYCDEIEQKKPDLVVLCGDIVEERTTLKQMKNAANILGHIKSRYGTFYVYGNHDKATYTSTPNFREYQLRNELINNRIHVLEDKIYNLSNDFIIIGRKDKGFSSEIDRKICKELLKNVDNHKFLLLMDHQPTGLDENSRIGIDLQLSGHTHGGQIWPTGLVGAGQMIYGYKRIGNYQIIVTSGIGGLSYPIRTGSHSEYVIIDVKMKK